ncbi:MAG: TetR/AcrR family transcriptional regulator [Rikenellaceae bacterium]|nr:TetR/AcrR family transcriptional regulator [Bacteroidales bacterium]NLH56080.1 TetR/AcrR family transcriptional regulator [Rikenellaceae bacterium]HOF91981.1 TetR/AcrR family transcriptional regulator [Tenuifilaceae bacterium]HOM84192.1 TetR/AcrR family transcriptional regulator [Tenuifilaceae bacterium]HOQ35571.1 TetR/AcrR family transcriptional regulator [Tenuifilaceae bacterium]
MNRNSQKTREKILKTATKLFLQKGVDQVGVREIAAKAGINLSLMNYYFQTKENLFETIFDSLVMDKAIKLRSILESDLPIEKKIRDYTNTYIDMLIGNPLLVSFVVSSLHRSPEQLKSMNAVVALYNSEVFCKHLISEAEAGRIRRVDPEQLYISMISLILFPFAIKELICDRNQFSKEEFQAFIEERKSIIPEMLIGLLKV